MKAHELKVPIPITNQGLQEMFELQTNLFTNYIRLGFQPMLKPDLDTREIQTFLKTLIYSMIEELGEVDDNYREMVNHWDKIPMEELVPYLKDFNEEFADVLHFMVELMIYSFISEDDIYMYYKKLLEEKNYQNILFKDNWLKTCFSYARQCNIDAEEYRYIFTIPAFKVTTNEKSEFVKAGSVISLAHSLAFKSQMWDVTYYLMQASHCLKNKPWKKTDVATDKDRYHNNLMEAWLHLIRLMDIMGFDENNTFSIYYLKNQICQQRIKDNY